MSNFKEILRNLQTSNIENQECSCTLYGLIHISALETLISRIEGLTGQLDVEPNLFEWECCFIRKDEVPIGPERNQDKLLRFRAAFDPSADSENKPEKLPWLGLYESPPIALENNPTVRHVTYVDVPYSMNPIAEMEKNGYVMAWEFARKGYYYIYKNSIWLRIYRLYELENLNNPNSLVALQNPNTTPATTSLTMAEIEQLSEANAQQKRESFEDDTENSPSQIFIVEFVLTKPASMLSKEQKPMLQTMLNFASLFQGIVELRSVSHLYLRNKIRYYSN